MRYPASEKLEIIRLVERSHLPVRRTLGKLGIPSTTFYRWYDRYRACRPKPGLKTAASAPAGCGTVSRMTFVARSSIWRWTSRSCRPGSWR